MLISVKITGGLCTYSVSRICRYFIDQATSRCAHALWNTSPMVWISQWLLTSLDQLSHKKIGVCSCIVKYKPGGMDITMTTDTSRSAIAQKDWCVIRNKQGLWLSSMAIQIVWFTEKNCLMGVNTYLNQLTILLKVCGIILLNVINIFVEIKTSYLTKQHNVLFVQFQ